MEVADARAGKGSVFSVRTEVFEGPMELLLELIEKRKLLINDISLASVTDEYMAAVAQMEEQSLGDVTQFVHLAATLLLIKSKSLLPVLELTQTEEESIGDLEDRLRRYQAYREAGRAVARAFGARPLHSREPAPITTPIFLPDQYADEKALADAIRRVVAGLPRTPEQPKVRVRKTITLEQMIERLHGRIERQMRLCFSDLAKSGERHDTIVGFLAVLEMAKQGTILVRQAKQFDDIEIEREGSNLPRYG